MKLDIRITTALLLVLVSFVYSWDHPRLATPGEFPYEVAIMWKPSAVAIHFTTCSGAIVNAFWYVTSAYCIAYVPDLGFNVIKAGAHNVNANEPHTQIIEIEKVLPHERYPGRSPVLSNLAYYDIGLVKGATPLTFNDFVKPIKLAKSKTWINKQKLDYNLVISGWGLFPHEMLPEPTTKRTVHLPVVPKKVCQASIRTIFPHITLSEMQICTRPIDGNIAGCIGNHGGPLIQYDKENNPVLVGIVNWTSAACSTNGLTPVYTLVTYFSEWIKKTTKIPE